MNDIVFFSESFFGNSPGGGGSYVQAPDSAYAAGMPFADATARDAWATANLTDLLKGAAVETTGLGWQRWIGDIPANSGSYNASNWTDTADVLRGPEGPAGVPGLPGESAQSLSARLQQVGTNSGYNDNDRMSQADADYVAKAISPNASFRNTNSRVMPRYRAAPSVLGFSSDAAGSDATADDDFTEIIIPATDLHGGMEIWLSRFSSAGSGNRFVQVYAGDPTSGGTLIIPTLGDETFPSTTAQATATYRIDNADNDVHVVMTQQHMVSFELANTAIVSIIEASRLGFRGGVRQIAGQGYVHGNSVPGDLAKHVFEGGGATVVYNPQGHAGRVDPILGNGSNDYVGFFGGNGSDPTSASSGLVEFVYERENITRGDVIEILRASSSGSGTRSIWAYDGDAVSGGVQILPLYGDTSYTSTANPVMVAFEIPDGLNDVHIYSSRQWILDSRIRRRTRGDELAAEAALRGSDVYDAFDSTVTYAANATVNHLGRNWTTINGAAAGAWDAADWEELSIQAVNTRSRDAGLPGSTAFVDFNNGLGVGWYTFLTIDNTDTRPANFRVEYQIGMSNRSATPVGPDLTSAVISAFGAFNALTTPGLSIDNLTQFTLGQGYNAVRLIRDDASDLQSTIRVQVYVDSASTMTASSRPYKVSDWLTVNQVADKWTDLGTQEVLQEINLEQWFARNIHSGTTGGVHATSVGEPGATDAWIDFSSGSVDIKAGAQTAGKFDADGVQFGGDEFGDWAATPVISDPFAVSKVFPTQTEVSNPLGNLTLTVTDESTAAGDWTRTNYVFAGNGGLPDRFLLAAQTWNNTSVLQFRIDGVVVGQTLRITTEHWKLGLGNTNEDQYEWFDVRNSVRIDTWNILNGGTAEIISHSVEYEVTTDDQTAGFVSLHLRRGIGGNTGAVNRPGFAAWHLDVLSVQPARDANVSAQIDSNHRGILIPSIAKVDGQVNPLGAMALSKFEGNRPIWNDGEDWAYVALNRSDSADVSGGIFMFATSGTAADQGWSAASLTRVADYNGFPWLIYFPPGAGTLSPTAPNNTVAFWTDCWARGFEVVANVLFENSTFHGLNIEPIGGAGWPAGRYAPYLQDGTTAGTFVVVDENSATISREFPAGDMYNLRIVCANPSVDTNAQVYLNGEYLFDSTHGGYNGGRGIFYYDVDNTRNVYYQSLSLYVLAAASIDRTLSRREIESNIRFVVPSVPNEVTLRVPIGDFSLYETFGIVNGASANATLTGSSGDVHLFNGRTSLSIPPNSSVQCVQTGFPRGNNWAVMGGQDTTRHTEGHTLFLSVNPALPAADRIVARSGTYQQDDIGITPSGTGVFLINVGTTILPDGTYTSASPYGNTDMTANADIAIGEVAVRLWDAAGAPDDAPFTVEIRW